MAPLEFKRGREELDAARRDLRGLLAAAFIFSIFVNLLMLTGPLYMLQVYDRVLGSGSTETLTALSILVVGLFLAMGVLDFVRGRVMAIVGARFQDRLDRRVFSAAMQIAAVAPNDKEAAIAQRDLEAIRSFLASPVLLALMDMPWAPFFMAAVFVFHPYLGWLAVAGSVVLVAVTWLNQTLSRRPQAESGQASAQSERFSDQMKTEAETLQALGMSGAGFDRWQVTRQKALRQAIVAAGVTGAFGTITKTFRLFLQSAMLGLGAWLVLQNQLSSGAMVASSVLMGRALAPIELVVGQWSLVHRYTEAWQRLSLLLSRVPEAIVRTALPRPVSYTHLTLPTICSV